MADVDEAIAHSIAAREHAQRLEADTARLEGAVRKSERRETGLSDRWLAVIGERPAACRCSCEHYTAALAAWSAREASAERFYREAVAESAALRGQVVAARAVAREARNASDVAYRESERLLLAWAAEEVARG